MKRISFFTVFFMLLFMSAYAALNDTFLISFFPDDLSTINKSSFTTYGKVNNDITELQLNGKTVELRPDHTFSAEVKTAEPGKYVISILGRTSTGLVRSTQKRFLRTAAITGIDTKDQTMVTLANAGLLPVNSAGVYKAHEPLSRPEAAELIARIKGYTFSTSAEALKKCISNGIFPTDPTSAHSKVIDRAEAVYIAVKLNGQILRKNIDPLYVDVPLSHWAAPYIDVAHKLGWLAELVPAGALKFQPLQPITKKEFITLMTHTKPFETAIHQGADWERTTDIKAAVIIPLGGKKLLSMDFSDVELGNVLKIFSQETGINVVYGRDVAGKVSAHFKEVEPLTALSAILQSTGYTYTVDGANLLRVIPAKGPNNARGDTKIKTFSISYANIDALMQELVKLVPTLQGKVLIGRSSNSLIIDARHPEIEKIEELVRRLDAPPPQVMVQAQIFQLSADNSLSFGTNMYVNQGETDRGQVKTMGFANDAPDNTYSGMYVKVLNGDYQAYFNALRARSDFELISSPKIMALNNQEAVLSTGEDVGYPEESIIYTSTGQTKVTTIKFLKAATELKFTPHISQDGHIMIDLTPIITEVSLSKLNVPTVKKTEAHTQVIVADGQTFIIGGLIGDKLEEVNREVPVLSSIPLLGELFKYKQTIKTKRNITVMVTPRIVDAFHVEEMTGEITNVKNTHTEFQGTK